MIFAPVTSFPYAAKYAWCLISYCLWSVAYTMVNVPYGSLHSVITDDPQQRVSLSTFRSIGGGVGGMEAAILCAKRGHKVTLYEKTDKLGGVFIAAAAPSFKEKDKALIAWYIRELSKYPITVNMNTEITDVKALDADEIIVATGAVAKKIPVKGADTAIEAIDFLLGKAEVGENVVVIGGGLTGCEIAYELYLNGKKPTIVEMQDDLITTKGVCLANTSFLEIFVYQGKYLTHFGCAERGQGEQCPVGKTAMRV